MFPDPGMGPSTDVVSKEQTDLAKKLPFALVTLPQSKQRGASKIRICKKYILQLFSSGTVQCSV